MMFLNRHSLDDDDCRKPNGGQGFLRELGIPTNLPPDFVPGTGYLFSGGGRRQAWLGGVCRILIWVLP